MNKRLVFTVTNDLTYDQRMIRICTSLAKQGYTVTLIGRTLPDSLPLAKMEFHQKRLACFFSKGFLFYAEYNIRLFFSLLFVKADLFCAIDLDTILPVLVVSSLRKKGRVYDAHELFCEMKEIVSRKAVYKTWKAIERFSVPMFRQGYTVNHIIADELRKMYGVDYLVIRNIPLMMPLAIPTKKDKYILYQGAVNEGRCFETLIPAFKEIDCKLIVCGDGNFMDEARKLVRFHHLENKISFTGKVPPAALKDYTLNATIGVTLFDAAGLSNYYSLANRFFDYMHAGIPQVCVDYPVYRSIIDKHRFALLTNELDSSSLAKQINRLLHDEPLYQQLQANCLTARKELNWQNEENTLISFYNQIVPTVE